MEVRGKYFMDDLEIEILRKMEQQKSSLKEIEEQQAIMIDQNQQRNIILHEILDYLKAKSI